MPEKKILLHYCGDLDPRDIGTFTERGGFGAWEKARNQMTPDSIVAEIKASGLKGRGGAPAFPAVLNGSWPAMNRRMKNF